MLNINIDYDSKGYNLHVCSLLIDTIRLLTFVLPSVSRIVAIIALLVMIIVFVIEIHKNAISVEQYNKHIMSKK